MVIIWAASRKYVEKAITLLCGGGRQCGDDIVPIGRPEAPLSVRTSSWHLWEWCGSEGELLFACIHRLWTLLDIKWPCRCQLM